MAVQLGRVRPGQGLGVDRTDQRQAVVLVQARQLQRCGRALQALGKPFKGLRVAAQGAGQHGVALATAVAALAPGLDAQLKWPNDLLVGGAKCAGILMERSGNSIVIGIGVNLVGAPELPDRATAALADKGARVERDRFADALAIAMTDALWTWRHEGIGRIIAAWLLRAHAVGTPLRVSDQGVNGLFDGLDPDGALRLRREDGTTMLIHAGDVELRRPVEEGK